MWTRKELKHQAKEALKRNYWRIVLVTLLLLALGNGNILGNTSSSTVETVSTVAVDETPAAGVVEEAETEEEAEEDTLGDVVGDNPSIMGIVEALIEALAASADKITENMGRTEIIITVVTFFVICFMIVIVMSVFMIAFVTFLVNPVIVGGQRFMLKSVDGKAEVKETAYAFDHSYKNVVKVMFHTQFSVFLWSLLFIVPGFYKKYQYRMVEYIMAEHPDMYYKDAMRLSTDMMDGEKWHALLLDLSFILWAMASLMTCGLAHILFVAPYQYLTNAALYRRLCALRSGQYSGAREGQAESGPNSRQGGRQI